MHKEKKDKGLFHPDYYKKLYEQTNERKETLQRMYDAAAHRETILKEKNKQLVDSLDWESIFDNAQTMHLQEFINYYKTISPNQ